jgi:hypothetical protein
MSSFPSPARLQADMRWSRSSPKPCAAWSARWCVRNPPELIIETILEGYRHELRILAGDLPNDVDADMFGELFTKAQEDGKLGAHVDVRHLSRLAQMHGSEGVRHWAAGGRGDRSFADVVTRDIAAPSAGHNQLSA